MKILLGIFAIVGVVVLGIIAIIWWVTSSKSPSAKEMREAFASGCREGLEQALIDQRKREFGEALIREKIRKEKETKK